MILRPAEVAEMCVAGRVTALLMPSSLRLAVFMVWLGFELGCTEDKFVSRAEIFQEKCEQPVAPSFQPASCAVLREGWRTDLLRRQSNQEGINPLVFSDEINALDL